MENNDFERQWQQAFDGAEINPSAGAWAGVELALEKAAGQTMRRRVLYYQWLAAASLIVSLGIGAFYFLSSTGDDKTTQGISQAESGKNLPASSVAGEMTTESIQPVMPLNRDLTAAYNHSLKKDVRFSKSVKASVPKETIKDLQPVSSAEELAAVPSGMAKRSEENDQYPKVLSPQKLYLLPTPPLRFTHNQSNADPGMVLLAKMKDEENKYRELDKKKKVSDENLWSAVGFGAGTFNPNASSNMTYRQVSAGNNANYSSSNPVTAGPSYTFGVQVGGQLANRFVLLGGISYLAQNASYTSNLATMDASNKRAALNEQAFTNMNAIPTAPYSVNSNLQYMSVPLQAGYMIINQKFGWQLNGGIATDFFLQNTLTASNDQIGSFSQGTGSDSPYRPVLFTGLAGTELSYRLADRYRLAINPGIRYSLQSIYKSSMAYDVAPVTLDVSLRFRYIFK